MPIGDWGSRGQRRLRRTLDNLTKAFEGGQPGAGQIDRAAAAYREAVRLAVAVDAGTARVLVRDYDHRLPALRYPFGAADESWLADQAGRDNVDVLAVVFAVSTRAALPVPQRAARDRMVTLLGPSGDADALVSHLRHWYDARALDTATLTAALRAHLGRAQLERAAPLWQAFFDHLPEAMLPELFDIHRFLGRGADAVRLADSPAARRTAIECCLASRRPADVRAGIELARRIDPGMIGRLTGRLGELLLDGGDVAGALEAFQEAADRPDLVSVCLERLGRFREAFEAAPADQPDVIARLAGNLLPEVDTLVEVGDYPAAARLVQLVVRRLDAAASPTDSITSRRAEVAAVRSAVLAAGRRHFQREAEKSADAYARWSRFEEDAGALAEAALRAERAGDGYRAHRLYRQAKRFGDADRVLRDDTTDAGLAARAAAREAGGDLIGAARLFQQKNELTRAAKLYEQAGDFTAAANCLAAQLGDDVVEDVRFGQWLRRAGAADELARRCLAAAARRPGSRVVDELRQLRRDPALSQVLRDEVVAVLDRFAGQSRRAFDARVQAWVAQARFEVDQRFAGIWALDLGTTTCAAAIYDTKTRTAVLCPWKGRPQFPSTLSLDKEGNELVGLTGEEVFAGWLVGHVGAVKRRIGSRTTYRMRGRTYRPEEVAARFIKHGRGLVESFLAERVRERVADLARAELGEVDDEWLTWTERHHDLRIDRPRVLVTIPAYFLNNQKHATRDACRIAGLDLVRLIHEPTAACMTAARERGLAGRIVVVDMGAGTLDISFLEVEQDIYDVRRVLGDNKYGGKDFDAVVTEALVKRLAEQGIQIPATGTARRRVEVAAEYLKASLSSQESADYLLRQLVDGATAGVAGSSARRDVRLELNRTQLRDILAEPLAALRRTCTELRHSLKEPPEHLVLVGGPMLSPLVQRVVEEVFGLARTPVPDPRTAAATGAALQAAVMDGKISEVLLLDVTPLALGLRVMNDQEQEEFSVLIPPNTRIPTQHRKTYTTHDDNQTAVDIEIYNGGLDSGARIGQIRLGDIPPAPRGVPKIEVTFTIDASCVLEVTAQDLGSGRSRSIRVTDTTVLSPDEVDDMARRQQWQEDLREVRRDLVDLVATADPDGAEAAWREMRTRMDRHRRATTTPDPATERTVTGIFNGALDVDRQLRSILPPLRDLAGKAAEYLARDPGPDTAQALAEGRHLVRELRDQMERLRPLLDRTAGWNATLVRLATAEPDPLHRFRQQHDTGDYSGALSTYYHIRAPLQDAPDVRRLLRCLAHSHDAEQYREVLIANAELLGIELGEPADMVRRALVRVSAHRPDGNAVRRRGFAVTGGFVVTNRSWFADTSGPTVDGLAVTGVRTPDNNSLDVAVLQTDRHQTGLPLGHAGLVRVGDRVLAPAASDSIVDGVVDRLESFPEEGLTLFRVGIRMPPSASGGPLVNDLGEVIGVLVLGQRETADAFALTVDGFAGLVDPTG